MTPHKPTRRAPILRWGIIAVLLVGAVAGGWTIRRMAIRRVYVENFGWFVQNGDLEAVRDALSAFPEAAEEATVRDGKVVVEYYEDGSRNAGAYIWGSYPVTLATRARQPAILEALLNVGATPDTAASLGEFAIQIAAWNGDVHIAQILLAAGADPDARSSVYSYKHGTHVPERSALGTAAYLGHCAVAKVLLAHGAEVDLADGDGATPLHRAAAGQYAEVVKALILAGADVNARNGDGDTPLDLASAEEDGPCVKLLRQHGAKAPKTPATH